VHYGFEVFEVGVLRITWRRSDPEVVNGVLACPALIVECRANRGSLPRGVVNTALCGAVVRSPSGALHVIRGVESSASASLYAGSEILILLVRMEEV
jgi:hypothetical protein